FPVGHQCDGLPEQFVKRIFRIVYTTRPPLIPCPIAYARGVTYKKLDIRHTEKVIRVVPHWGDFVAKILRTYAACNFDLCRDFPIDRKSTRLNSSHVKNSYAVFC